MKFNTKEEHEAWLKERDSYDGHFVMPEAEICISLGYTDYWHKTTRYPRENTVSLSRLGNFWIVRYAKEHQLELEEHFTTRDAALFEMDRIMEWGDYDERVVCHCGRCNALFDCSSVSGLCPMCGADHNRKDFDKYLGWSIWNFHPADYAGAMYRYWKKHLEWRKNNNMEYPDWVDVEDNHEDDVEDDADN